MCSTFVSVCPICVGDSGGPILQWMGDRWEQVNLRGVINNSTRSLIETEY